MYRLLAFSFASDAAEADKSDATIVPTGLQIVNSTTVCKLSHLDELRTALVEILGQADDGVDDTEKKVVGGAGNGADLVVKYARAKTTAFVSGLVAFGLVVVTPGPVVRD